MYAFCQYISIQPDDRRTLMDPYPVNTRDVRGDGADSDETTEVYPMLIDQDKALEVYNQALESNKSTPGSVLYTNGLTGPLMLYEVEYTNCLSLRLGEITAAYFAAVTAVGPGGVPYLLEREDYDGMDKVVCRAIQYLAMKLNYVKKCRSYAEYERWENEERGSMWPMVLGNAWLVPLYHMLPHEELLKVELDRLEPPKKEEKKEGYRNEDEDDGRRATR